MIGKGPIEKTLPQSKILGVFGMNYFVVPDEFSSIHPITWVQLEAACTALDMKFWWKKLLEMVNNQLDLFVLIIISILGQWTVKRRVRFWGDSIVEQRLFLFFIMVR
ncbi:hypothetical protein V8G54_005264 [Vigna mungo]|uniref:Uncharacterized protein n=1 Tax=Vigna mungo TaxID=3915 RepID=A0AAQ3S5C0_VIGMU